MNTATHDEALPYVCCGCGAPFELGAYKTCNCATNCGFLRGDLLAPALAAKPRCAWCNEIPTLANLDGEDLCHACCTKWARGEGIVDNDPEEEGA